MHWRASQRAGLKEVPVVVKDVSAARAFELALVENLQREDLHPLDEAMAFERMQTELGYSYAQIGERLGKSKGYVQNRMRLLSLDDDLMRIFGGVNIETRLPGESERDAHRRRKALDKADRKARPHQQRFQRGIARREERLADDSGQRAVDEEIVPFEHGARR